MIDETIAPLIKAMNRIPFIETLSCCGGHPEESAVQEYGYAVANVLFEVQDEAENVIRWYGMMQEILHHRKTSTVKHEYAFIFAKKFLLNDDDYLSWQWELNIQATGATIDDCRAGLDEGIIFLTAYFNEVKK